ncbi:hypothetical protein [Nonomuraea zeae]|uniref:Uncharacterized protein n=1 Tax=Nonomuraea zeae TaxID=1642303 RepID=A0A5S4GYT8_9ACTN|nr:hypothetical protein [Nonomuraea zeae]TMR38128.1 hypothetical protein ETD85_05715 [Nonomuraea zeae]
MQVGEPDAHLVAVAAHPYDHADALVLVRGRHVAHASAQCSPARAGSAIGVARATPSNAVSSRREVMEASFTGAEGR